MLPRRKGVSRQLLDSAKARETSEWAGLSTKDKFSKWVARHQYQVIVGGWAASMAVAGTIIMRDRYVYASYGLVIYSLKSLGISLLRKRLSRLVCGRRA